jgi:hypothetical protein
MTSGICLPIHPLLELHRELHQTLPPVKHLNYLIQLKGDMVERKTYYTYIDLTCGSLEFHADVATIFMQALDYSFQQRRVRLIKKLEILRQKSSE